MPPRRRVAIEAGRDALDVCRRAGCLTDGDPADVARETVATAVRYLLEELATRAPGRTLEVRVPPYGAAQCIEGPVHRRGTPPNVIETDPRTWLRLATGALDWDDALDAGLVRASGQRAHLDGLLPVVSS